MNFYKQNLLFFLLWDYVVLEHLMFDNTKYYKMIIYQKKTKEKKITEVIQLRIQQQLKARKKQYIDSTFFYHPSKSKIDKTQYYYQLGQRRTRKNILPFSSNVKAFDNNLLTKKNLVLLFAYYDDTKSTRKLSIKYNKKINRTTFFIVYT